jgi:hypothetical protein
MPVAVVGIRSCEYNIQIAVAVLDDMAQRVHTAVDMGIDYWDVVQGLAPLVDLEVHRVADSEHSVQAERTRRLDSAGCSIHRVD